MLFCFASRVSNTVQSQAKASIFQSKFFSCLGWLCHSRSLWLVTRAKVTRSIVNSVLVSCRTPELGLFVLVFVLWHFIMSIHAVERVSLLARFCERGSQGNFHKFLHEERGGNPLEEKEGDHSRSILRVVRFSSAWIGWIWTSSPLQSEGGKFEQSRTWLILPSE